MTPYTMLHLALAGALLVLSLVHFATWAAVRSQRVQLWLASSFLGFAVLSRGRVVRRFVGDEVSERVL